MMICDSHYSRRFPLPALTSTCRRWYERLQPRGQWRLQVTDASPHPSKPFLLLSFALLRFSNSSSGADDGLNDFNREASGVEGSLDSSVVAGPSGPGVLPGGTTYGEGLRHAELLVWAGDFNYRCVQVWADNLQ